MKNNFIFSFVSVNFICFSTGIAYSWTSPLIPKFQSSDPTINPIGRPLTTSEYGLLVSIINLGQLCGPIVPALLVAKLGKKTTLLISGLPLFISHIVCLVATSYEVFLVARFLMGLTTGAVWASIPGYLSEISEPTNRGVLNSLTLVVHCSGGLAAYLIGPFVSITWFSIINLIPAGLFLTLVYLFVPDSPYDLVLKNNLEAAEKSLIKLRQTSIVQKELLEIERIIESNTKNRTKISNIFKNKATSSALFICGMLMAFNASSGILVVLGYTQTIFEMSGSVIPAAYSAIMVGAVSVLATIGNAQFIDRLGRKPIGIFSCSLACLSHASLGIFFYFKNNGYNIEQVGWLPLCSVITFMFSYYFGLASLPWMIQGELFSTNIKDLASSFCSSINFILGFSITLAYPYILDILGISNTFLTFAFCLAMGAAFVFWKVPETKGKSFEEIYILLKGTH